MAGYGVDPAALKEIGNGINGAITELKTLGIDAEAEQGRGFSSLEMSADDVGHDELNDAFTQFCERWAWGVRTLVQDGSEFAHRIGLAAGRYADQEKYAKDLVKSVAGAVIGNPHETDEQYAQQSFEQIAGAVEHVDYSAESWGKAGDQMSAQWSAAGRAVLTSAGDPVQALAQATGDGAEYQRGVDDLFGPAPQPGHG
ncbi:hypothetical protein ATK36_2709 [Amycolatopsis sulphurea]|uniref:Uncharacterized protein n=1 Tax=Amycolatopsis sulphurea TaxID=76022 RepID=A0A2A9FAT5_9PSEU|nr:hypothetical protein [Amycolatopsis sulphurea]PFG47662.1 hypothetical protein ATK36_2709 [Amycolatopsis sulphurea]